MKIGPNLKLNAVLHLNEWSLLTFFLSFNTADLKAVTHENTLRFEAGKVDDDICKCDTTTCNCCKTVTAEGMTKTGKLYTRVKSNLRASEGFGGDLTT